MRSHEDLNWRSSADLVLRKNSKKISHMGNNQKYKPIYLLQLGHEWTESLRSSMQNGIRQHPHPRPKKQSPPKNVLNKIFRII